MVNAPCIVCGTTDYPLSMGGPQICPSCDCGIDPAIRKKDAEIERLLLKHARETNVLLVALEAATTEIARLKKLNLMTDDEVVLELKADRMIDKTYLGDAVYAEWDRGMLKLTAWDGIEVTNTIYLEPEVIAALQDYLKASRELPPGSEGNG